MANIIEAFRISPLEHLVAQAEPETWVDRLALGLVSELFSFKAICLFSMLFGYGLAMQYDTFSRFRAALPILLRRLLILLLFGLLHMLLIWNGDILTHYAIVGLISLPFLLMRKTYLLLGASLSLVIFLIPQWQPWTIHWASEAQLRSAINAANEVIPGGSYLEIIRLGWRELPLIFPLDQFIFPRTLGLFLFGAWCHRVALVQKIQLHRRRYRFFALATVILYLLESGAEQFDLFFEYAKLADALVNVAPILLSMGYAAFVLSIRDVTVNDESQGFQGSATQTFAAVGKMAFTNYLMQSVLLTWIFYGYGLGQFNKMGEAKAFVLGCVIYLGQIVFSLMWLRRFQLGPLEWLWRSMMFGRWQPLFVPTARRSE
ncbi:MAG: DUF418 domain-containing protein [Burkholderiaceae bacterium]|nr:DUF418 domain-containing protein [Burkholderiaceae bacterium]